MNQSTSNIFTPEVRNCLQCNRPFMAMRYNAYYDTLFCRGRANRKKLKERAASERDGRVTVDLAATKLWIPNPSVHLLNLREQELLTKNEAFGFGFTGTVPLWQPSDPRIVWEQRKECWQMLFLPTADDVAFDAAKPMLGSPIQKQIESVKQLALSQYKVAPTTTTPETSTPTGMPEPIEVQKVKIHGTVVNVPRPPVIKHAEDIELIDEP